MENQIRKKLLRYVSGRASLDDIESWLLAETWDLDEAAEPGAAELAYGALLAVAEHGLGHASEAELRNRLRSLAHTANFGSPPKIATATSSSTHRAGWAQPRLVAADRRSEAVPA